MVDAVEVLRDIGIDHPAAALLHEACPQRFQGVMGRASGPKAVRAGQKVRLVDRLQHHQDRPLRHLVFERRDAERASRSIRLRDVVAAHRRRAVAARLDPVQQAFEVGLQILFVVGSGHAVDACRPILARLEAIRFAHPFAVDQVVQGREHPFRMLPRLFGYPLLFR